MKLLSTLLFAFLSPMAMSASLRIDIPQGYEQSYHLLGKTVETHTYTPSDPDNNKTSLDIVRYINDKRKPTVFLNEWYRAFNKKFPDNQATTRVSPQEKSAVWSITYKEPYTKQMHYILLKVIAYDDLYAIKKTFKYMPSPEEITWWNDYLDDSKMCQHNQCW